MKTLPAHVMWYIPLEGNCGKAKAVHSQHERKGFSHCFSRMGPSLVLIDSFMKTETNRRKGRKETVFMEKSRKSPWESSETQTTFI
jgi:hypothetical protein